MAKASRGPFAKRQKELARQERQREKRANRLAAKEGRGATVPRAPDEDPDLAGIRLGPQPATDDEASGGEAGTTAEQGEQERPDQTKDDPR